MCDWRSQVHSRRAFHVVDVEAHPFQSSFMRTKERSGEEALPARRSAHEGRGIIILSSLIQGLGLSKGMEDAGLSGCSGSQLFRDT